MKKVYCLYRVSTNQQLQENDIPMQRQACHEFANEKGWSIEKEYYEKGVSGFKLSAEKRDAIQAIKCAAAKREFDVLLVFMFDRLGRREDETPFIVEWFVRNGVAVWSVKEGEQRFDNHIDKLLNYIQFWQASGESIKISIRTKTRMEQLTREGYYTGGSVPYGYRLVHRGRFNRQNREVYDLEIDPDKTEIVRMIYQKYAFDGMGTFRIARYLTSLGIPSAQEDHWHTHSVSYILQNTIYIGFLKKGAAMSDRLPHLQIIEDALFERAQTQRQSYLSDSQSTRRFYQPDDPMLLLGLAYCGHCGKRLTRGTGNRKRPRKNGSVAFSLRQRYICGTRMAHKERCGGQSGYGMSVLEETVLDAVTKQLQNMTLGTCISAYQRQSRAEAKRAERQKQINEDHIARLTENLSSLHGEVVKCLNSESEIGIGILQGAIEDTRQKIKLQKAAVEKVEEHCRTLKQREHVFLDLCSKAYSMLELLHSGDSKVMIELLHGFVRRIDVFGVTEVKIEYHFTLPTLESST